MMALLFCPIRHEKPILLHYFNNNYDFLWFKTRFTTLDTLNEGQANLRQECLFRQSTTIREKKDMHFSFYRKKNSTFAI